jgi:hypothetical protein
VEDLGRADPAMPGRDWGQAQPVSGAPSASAFAGGPTTLVEATAALVTAFWPAGLGVGPGQTPAQPHAGLNGHSANGHAPNGHSANGHAGGVYSGGAYTSAYSAGAYLPETAANEPGAYPGEATPYPGDTSPYGGEPGPYSGEATPYPGDTRPYGGEPAAYAGEATSMWAPPQQRRSLAEELAAEPVPPVPDSPVWTDAAPNGHSAASAGFAGPSGSFAMLAPLSPLDAPLSVPLEPSSLADFGGLPPLSTFEPAPWRDEPLPEPPSADAPWSYSGRASVGEAPVWNPYPDTVADPVEPATSGSHARPADDAEPLPTRVPTRPDVPDVPLSATDPLVDPGGTPAVADKSELSRIADFLNDRDDDFERTEGFDVTAILNAVKGVRHVRDAKLRWNPGGVHTLRLDLVDGADAGRVSREVARLLQETMGLAAEPIKERRGEDPLERSGGGGASVRVPVDPSGPARLQRPYVTTAGVAAAGRGRIAHPGSAARPAGDAGLRVVIDHVQVTTLGLDATVEVRLDIAATEEVAIGTAHGPAVDAYLLRLAANAAADAIDQLLLDPGTDNSRARCFIEHVALVPFGGCEVAIVVLLLVQGTVVEQLCGSSIVAGDPRQAVVRATLAAVNRRLEELLA